MPCKQTWIYSKLCEPAAHPIRYYQHFIRGQRIIVTTPVPFAILGDDDSFVQEKC
jgi:hypothetical protein